MGTVLRLILLASIVLFLQQASAQPPSVINVEIDWMADGTHSHRPTQAEINAVVQMFACHGITLNAVIDDSIQHFNVLRRDPADSNNFFGYNNGPDTFGGIKAANFTSGTGWHYCVFAHQYQDKQYNTSGSSGLGEQPGDDFVVTLGAFNANTGTSWQRTSTFAHELGHNLGLNHAGNMNPSVVGNNTPTVPSIMTYFFQLAGVRTNLICQGLAPSQANLFKELDYSNGIGCSVDENALDENIGIGMRKVDWNCNNIIGGVIAQDISNNSGSNGWCGATGPLQNSLSDYNEWVNIQDVTSATYAKHGYMSVEVSCITFEEYQRYRNATGGCLEPPVVNEACVVAQMFYVRPGIGSGNGTCTFPYLSLSAAYSSVVNGDVLYFARGNYPISGPMTLSRRCTLAGPGGAVLGTP